MGDQCTAVVGLRGNAARPFSNEQLTKIEEFLQPYAVGLELVNRASRSLVSHTSDSVCGTVRSLAGRGRWGAKAVLVGIIAFVMWFSFGTMEYSVTVPCTVLPSEFRHFCAPHEARLQSSNVVEGDRVRKGDVLCQFDTRALEMERSRLEAELAIARLNQDRARADGELVQARLAAVTVRKQKASLAIIGDRIRESVVVAPFDGTVVRGDLRRRIGQILPHGEPLFELSSDRGWTLKLMVPESEMETVSKGMFGRYASNARPEQAQTFRIVRLSPSAVQHDAQNIYACEARIDTPSTWVRSGMEGAAKIQTGRKPVWWVITHGALDSLRLKFWL